LKRAKIGDRGTGRKNGSTPSSICVGKIELGSENHDFKVPD